MKKVLEIFEGTRWLAALISIGSESESGESRQAVERLKGLSGSLRDLIPFGNRGEMGQLATKARLRHREVAPKGRSAYSA